MYSYGPPHMAGQKQDDQLEQTSSSYVRISDVALKTYQRWWTIGRSGEKGSGISVLVHDMMMMMMKSCSSFQKSIWQVLFCHRKLWRKSHRFKPEKVSLEIEDAFYCRGKIQTFSIDWFVKQWNGYANQLTVFLILNIHHLL